MKAKTELGIIIKHALINKGMSQSELAKITGVSPTSIGEWILGRKYPSYHNILLIAKILEIEDQVFPQTNKNEKNVVTRKEFDELAAKVDLLMKK